MKAKLFLLFLVCTQVCLGQQRKCGMQEKQQQLLANPELKKKYLEGQAKFQLEYKKILQEQSLQKNTNVTINIPVAVHFPEVVGADETLKACLRSLVQTQINVLNADFNAANSALSNWAAASTFYPGVTVGNLNVHFVLATQNHPASSGLVNGNVAVTFGTSFLSSDADANWSGYFNFLVKPLSGGVLGYSPFPGSISAGHSVVINSFAFGTGSGCTGYSPASNFNLGRTTTHEVGHFFNLDHTFGEENGCVASNTDAVDDTPKLGSATYGCPNNGSVPACISGEFALTMNYMDYVDDACMYMFTLGQKNRMLAQINAILPDLRTNVLSDNNFISSNFSVYPNPNNGTFNLKFKEIVSDFTIEIFDLSGKVVYLETFKQNAVLDREIKIQNKISKGLYFLNFKTKEELITKKIILE